jgi:hypothetical protein
MNQPNDEVNIQGNDQRGTETTYFRFGRPWLSSGEKASRCPAAACAYICILRRTTAGETQENDMGEQESRVAISGVFINSESLCSASSKPVGCGGTGSEHAGGWRSRKDANTRLAIDADSGITPRQPCPPGLGLSVHTCGGL